ncbi:MAG: RNA polymerase sigma factor [Myxococcota bacterium]
MPDDRDDAEAERIARARAGDREAFDALIADHSPRLLTLASRMLGTEGDAQNAVQEAWASAWLALDRFDERRSLGPWLATITVNKCRDFMRRRRVERWLRFDAPDGVDDVADAGRDQERQLSDRRMVELVRREIARLPAALKEPFVLVTFDERSQAEAAAILGLSRKSVESRIYRARSLLRERLSKWE